MTITKRLILMRHAEAQPAHLAPVDRDRPLALAGLQELEKIRGKLQKELQDVTLVLCSNSRRTRQTLEAIRAVLSSRCESEFIDSFYQATPDVILKKLTGLSDEHKSILIIGHNPSLSQFLSHVISCNPSSKFVSLSTSDVAVCHGTCEEWKNITYPKLHLENVLRP